MSITVNLVGVTPDGNTQHFSVIAKKARDVTDGMILKSWLHADLNPYHKQLHLKIEFDAARNVIDIYADNEGLTAKIVKLFRNVVEKNFRNFD